MRIRFHGTEEDLEQLKKLLKELEEEKRVKILQMSIKTSFFRVYLDIKIQQPKIVEVEGKERYEITDAYYFCSSEIFDTETDERLRLYKICYLLNQQSKRIKEWEENYKKLENCYYDTMEKYHETLNKYRNIDFKFKLQQLQLYDLPKKIVEEIRKQIIKDVDVTPDYHDEYDLRLSTRDKCIECLDTILKKYGGDFLEEK